MWKTGIKKYILDYFLIIIGTFFMAVSTALLLLPNQLSTGGFSGIATIAYYFLHLNIGGVIIALNIPLFIIAFFRIGRDFLVKTIIGTILYSVFTNVLNSFNPITSDSFLKTRAFLPELLTRAFAYSVFQYAHDSYDHADDAGEEKTI